MNETTIAQQLMMNNLSMTSQIMQSTFSAISNIGNLSNSNNNFNIADLTVTNSLGSLAYAVEGDAKYDEEIDVNNDGIITYNEYVKSITDSISSRLNIPKSNTIFSFGEDSQTGLLTFSVQNIGKILTAYMNNSIQLPLGIIEKEI